MTPQERETFRLHGRLPVVQQRIKHSLELIREWRRRCHRPYVAWSGGKDSTVCLWLALQIDPDIEAVYFDADSCLPDTRELIERVTREWHVRYREVKTRPLLDVLAEYGLSDPYIEDRTMKATVYDPIRQMRAEGYDGVIVGVRADESRHRGFAVSQRGELFDSKASGMLTCWPVARWTSRDIWGVIVSRGLPYNTAYNKTRFTEFERMRVSYWAGETYRTYGRYAWLRYYYPDLYAKLVAACPEVQTFT